MRGLVFLVPGLPLLGFAINLLFGRYLPKRVVGWLATVMVGAAFVIAIVEYLHLLSIAAPRVETGDLFTWFQVAGLKISWGFYLDPLSAAMILFVTGVATLIHAYSIGYMDHDPRFRTFFVYLNLFVFSMLTLVLANNFVLTFLGWEGVGACSYWLISFWFHRHTAASAGKKAFIVNRIGDFGYMVGMFLLFKVTGTLNYGGAFNAAHHGVITSTDATAIALLFFLGAAGKSAQIPLFVWLVDAMEGPTPVSALIHAATMVTAGVYLMARISPILHLSASAGTVIAIFGVVTAFVAAAAATSQNDIKKVLAYSTVSQLGYMFLGIGSGAYVAAIFLMITHAFYKGLLFLGAGSVIHSLHDEQDIKKMGGLYKLMPITGFTFIIAWLSIAGLPPFSGFFSKGDVLLGAYTKSPWLWALGALTAVLTAYYMGREVYLVFFGDARYAKALAGSDHHAEPHESPAVMTVPLVVLAFASVVAGVLNLGFSSSTDFLANWLTPVFGTAEAALGFGTGTRAILEAGDAVFAIIGILLAWRAWASRSENPSLEPRFLVKAWGIDIFLDRVFSGGSQVLAHSMNAVVDNAVIDGAVKGTGTLVAATAGQVRKLQSGYVRSYALVITFGVVLILGFVLTRASF
ncbi:MAG: NADH-quinone oxidoreductase subunit L [Actinomycetota bacterium]|nr:NADH-quinone oxidoreductase subunit L [Actinomycetota bacterium]